MPVYKLEKKLKNNIPPSNIFNIQEIFALGELIAQINIFNCCPPDRFHDLAQGVLSMIPTDFVFPRYKGNVNSLVNDVNKNFKFYHGKVCAIEFSTWH